VPRDGELGRECGSERLPIDPQHGRGRINLDHRCLAWDGRLEKRFDDPAEATQLQVAQLHRGEPGFIGEVSQFYRELVQVVA